MATKRKPAWKAGKVASRPRRVRKNMDMDPVKLAAVKKLFGVSTETEAVDRAFDEILFEHRVSAGLERLASAGGLPKTDPDA
jgi:hypothetical protein